MRPTPPINAARLPKQTASKATRNPNRPHHVRTRCLAFGTAQGENLIAIDEAAARIGIDPISSSTSEAPKRIRNLRANLPRV
jgi:hypothetical protein